MGCALAFLVTPACLASSDPGEAPPVTAKAARRVLILSSFGTDFALFSQISATVRAELTQNWSEPFDIFELSLEHGRGELEERQAPFVDYLAALFTTRPLALVVTLGGPAARFAQRHRESLFPDVPCLYAAFDLRVLDSNVLSTRDATVPTEIDVAGTVDSFLRLAPETETLAVVIGNSPLERFWRGEIARELGPYEDRLQLRWTDSMSLAEIRGQVANLPPRSAVLFVMLLVDGAGVPHSQSRALASVAQVSDAPIFGLFDVQVGQGALGGRRISMEEAGARTAAATSRLLRGEAPVSVRYPPLRQSALVYDGRELERWRVPESRLPPGSTVRFRLPSRWSTYRWQILAGLAVFALQSALIVGLLAHRARRRTAEGEVRALHGSLLTSYELERRRLARELHDDVTQRLARLAMDAAQIERRGAAGEAADLSRRMREELARLTDDVHDLSRRLHPSVLFDLGLAEALRSEAERFAAAASMVVDTRLEAESAAVSPEVALCLYRVAQESLRNVARHARANHVEISLTVRDAGVELSVRDDGRGFDVEAARAQGGLGLVSLRERLHLVGGRLTVHSASWRGTTVVAWVPVAEAAS